jgi:hypothetical protein
LNPAKVDVHELIAWGLDEYSYRNAAIGTMRAEFALRVMDAQRRVAGRDCYASCSALLAQESENMRDLLADAGQRIDLQEEYGGLDWTLSVVDLRCLLAFQRRLVFSSAQSPSPIPSGDDWPQLISLAVGPQRDTRHRLAWRREQGDVLDISLRSDNPDLQLRLNPRAGRDGPLPLVLHGGSPFFEVAELRGRWFLRDGYHRAYRLLQRGVHRIPAVVIRTRTIEELGATEPWFFHEEQLFSDHPPRVMDFLDDDLIFRYERAALHKVIRIRVEESLEPFDETEEVQGEKR